MKYLDCEHKNTTPKWLLTSNGGKQLRPQCSDCGHVGECLPHHMARHDTPEVDQEARDRRHELIGAELDQRWAARREQWEAQRDAEREDWFAQHNEYLNTPEWWTRRQAVMNRAGGLCEGC